MTVTAVEKREVPDKPGVYIMKDEAGAPIYVGKAKSLRSRVRSYFAGDKDIKTRFLLNAMADIEVIITNTEYEALIRVLRRIRELAASAPAARYVVHGDSQLVIRQMEGRYRVRQAHLEPLHREARRLAAGLPVSFRWVPRDRNWAGHVLESR